MKMQHKTAFYALISLALAYAAETGLDYDGIDEDGLYTFAAPRNYYRLSGSQLLTQTGDAPEQLSLYAD